MYQVFSSLRIYALSKGNVMLATVVVTLAVTPIWANLLVCFNFSPVGDEKYLERYRKHSIGHNLNTTLWMAVSLLDFFHQTLISRMYHTLYSELCMTLKHSVAVRHVKDALPIFITLIFVFQ